MDTALFFAYTAAYLTLLVWGIGQARRHGWVTPASVLILVVLGLVYDNAVIGTGRFVGEGELLAALSLPRYWLHGILTPLLVLFSWHAIARTGAKWARTAVAKGVAVLFTIALVVLEFVTVIIGLRLDPTSEYGVVSYSNADSGGGPPVMVLGVALALVIAGVIVWKRTGWPWMLIGSVVMVIGSAVPIPVDSGAVTNAFELVLLTSLLATRQFQDTRGERHSVGQA